MFDTFKSNVKRYPRTALIFGGIYGGVLAGVIGSSLVMHLHLMTVVITSAEALGVVAAFDLLTYIWVFSDAGRTSVFLDILDSIEGRKASTSIDDYTEVEGDECSGCEVCDPKHTLTDDAGQDVAEYAVMLAVILAIVIGVIHLIGSHAGAAINGAASQIAGQ